MDYENNYSESFGSWNPFEESQDAGNQPDTVEQTEPAVEESVQNRQTPETHMQESAQPNEQVQKFFAQETFSPEPPTQSAPYNADFGQKDFYRQAPQQANSNSPYGYYNAPQAAAPAKKTREKRKSGFGVIAVAVACAILGSIAGGGVVGFMLRNKNATVQQPALSNQQQLEATTPTSDQLLANTSSNQSGKYMTPAQVYQTYVDSVVGIKNEGTVTNIYGQISATASSGTGFIITEDGYIISNNHVVEGAKTLTVTLHDGTKYEAKIIGSDSENDVSLLKIEANGLTVAPLGDSSNLKVGDEVAAIGNPLGELDFSLTVGYISALDREINTDGKPINMLQTDAAINSGNSGGPLFDMYGNVVGITTAKYSGSTNSGTLIESLGFAIPINDAKSIVSDLKEHGYVTGRPYMGVKVGDIDSSYMFYYDYPSSAYIASVESGSCAEKAGIQKGDIITALGDHMVKSYTDLVTALKEFKAGDTTKITIYREGKKVVLDITFDEITPDMATEPETEEQQPTQPELPDFGFDWGNLFP